MTSWLFVPADSERKLAKAQHTDATDLILDLEDAVLPERKAVARGLLREVLVQGALTARTGRTWVRINALDSGDTLEDLRAATCRGVSGVVLPKLRGPEDLDQLTHYLEAAEAFSEVPPGTLKIVALCTETPAAVLRMGELTRGHWPRLAGLMWGGEDLSTALGAVSAREPDGRWRPVIDQARSLCLLAAHALGVAAIDTVYVDFRNAAGCRESALRARADGFNGKLAIHPEQVAIINTAFTPTAEELARARRVVAAFASGAGAVSLDGQMLDLPHLRQARRLLAQSSPTTVPTDETAA